MRNGHTRLVLVTVSTFFLACAPALACQGKSFTWDPNDPSHPGDGTSWSDQNNWEPHDQGVPGQDDTVSISGAGAFWSEAQVNGAADVCSMSIDAGAGPVFITDAGTSIDVSQTFSMSGALLPISPRSLAA